ncbi:DUF3995 domain-containing protein [Tenacibaculum sp. S7007]|uniref:DUF3995 domain-containing protein n=1 Tax=Tenacibaculum pelagium TaxID=2759527 RepID=A0A839ALS4_9FLAO|nr:DUF3995 domain-containing protein [Tenacibaculum pelagium]MBA6155320.1 DUF3995 domain-containing protein [Tenacibaculum pelagium]
MIYFLGWIAILQLIFISGIHFYWAFGGIWGMKDVSPTKTKDEKIICPPWIATLIVAVVMVGFTAIYAEKMKLVSLLFLPNWLLDYGMYIVVSIFIIRAIGEFNYVGFFKRIKNTRFAKNDTKYFSPLCLFLGVVGMLIEIYK